MEEQILDSLNERRSSGQINNLPTDILQEIFNRLNHGSTRVARLACSKWFNIIKYSEYQISFARSEILPSIVNRLSKYQWPIDLKFTKVLPGLTYKECFDRISNMNNLQSLRLFAYGSAQPEDYYALTNLRNLTYLQILTEVEPQFYSGFTKLKVLHLAGKEKWKNLSAATNNFERFYQLESMQLFFTSPEDFKNIPTTLTYLECRCDSSDTQLIDLRHLTKLQTLDSNPFSGKLLLPPSLNKLTMARSHFATNNNELMIEGLERQQHLTYLNYRHIKLNSLAFNQIQQMTQLTSALIYVIRGEVPTTFDLFTSQHSKLTRLDMIVDRTLRYNPSTLPESLLSLELMHQDSSFSDITIDFSTMAHLTRLRHLKIPIGVILQSYSCLTRLTQLESLVLMNIQPIELRAQLLALTKLTRFEVTNLSDYSVIAQMTNLLELTLHSVTRDYSDMQSLTNLTSLSTDALEWESFVPYLVSLRKLEISGDHSQKTIDFGKLSALSNLTELNLPFNADLSYLTVLTRLQSFFCPRPTKLTDSELFTIRSKLTRLYSINFQ